MVAVVETMVAVVESVVPVVPMEPVMAAVPEMAVAMPPAVVGQALSLARGLGERGVACFRCHASLGE
jgi:hypothetical protein